LWEAEYNLLLGSAYLGRMINAYDGSYISAIAAYNGGPGNVNKWRAEFGRPGSTTEQSLRWLESIPFAETRNYVQRVLENLQIYRARLGRNMAPPLIKDLVR
jgi:soluble lytic murein transglycosylase